MDRNVIHLINYDHSKLFDSINPKNDISIKITKPTFDIGDIYIISPDFEGKTFPQYTLNEEFVEIIISSLEIYNVIIVSKQDEAIQLENINIPGYIISKIFS